MSTRTSISFQHPSLPEYPFPCSEQTKTTTIVIEKEDVEASAFKSKSKEEDYDVNLSVELNSRGEACFPEHLMKQRGVQSTNIPKWYYFSRFVLQSLESYPCTLTLSQNLSITPYVFIGGLGSALNAAYLEERNIKYVCILGDAMPPAFNGVLIEHNRPRTVRSIYTQLQNQKNTSNSSICDIRVTYTSVSCAQENSVEEWLRVFETVNTFMNRVIRHRDTTQRRVSETANAQHHYNHDGRNTQRENTGVEPHSSALGKNVSGKNTSGDADGSNEPIVRSRNQPSCQAGVHNTMKVNAPHSTTDSSSPIDEGDLDSNTKSSKAELTDSLRSRNSDRLPSVLIHSFHGCHRAPVVCASWLIRHHRMTVPTAIAVISAARPMARFGKVEKQALVVYAELHGMGSAGLGRQVLDSFNLAANDQQAFSKLILNDKRLLFVLSTLVSLLFMFIWGLIYGRQTWEWAQGAVESHFQEQLRIYNSKYYTKRSL